LIWGNPGGSGNWNGEGMGRGRSVYKQPGGQGGRDRTTQEEGFQVSRRDSGKGEDWQGELAEGSNKGNNGELRHNLNIANLCMCITMMYECN
jgi:hypothetical protein